MALTSSYVLRTRVARKQRRTGIPNWILIGTEIAVPIALLAWWWIASAASTNTFFPPLQNILTRLGELSLTSSFWDNVSSSVTNLVISFVLASLLGIAVGSLLGLSRTASSIVDPVIHFFRAIPPVAIVPVFVSLLGFGNETRIVSITLAAVFPVLIATVDGVRGANRTLRMVSRVYRLRPMETLFSVVLPSASPRIMAGMQVSLISAFVVMIASEMLGSSRGLGAATLLAQQSFAITDMWVGVLVLGIIGYAATAIFSLLRRRVLRWYIASQKQEKDG